MYRKIINMSYEKIRDLAIVILLFNEILKLKEPFYLYMGLLFVGLWIISEFIYSALNVLTLIEKRKKKNLTRKT